MSIGLEREINTAINELLKTRKPSILVTEDLSHLSHSDPPWENDCDSQDHENDIDPPHWED